MWMFLVGSGWLADMARARNLMSTTNIRKLMNGVGESLYVCDLWLFSLCGHIFPAAERKCPLTSWSLSSMPIALRHPETVPFILTRGLQNTIFVVPQNWSVAPLLIFGSHNHHHHNRFTALFPGPFGWAGARRELLDFMVPGKINKGTHRPSGWTPLHPD